MMRCILISGVSFIDNNSTESLTSGNGVAITRTKFSKSVSICFWIFPIWSRFLTWIGLLEIRTDLSLNNTEKVLNLKIEQELKTREGKISFSNYPNFEFHKKFPFIGLMRKWSNLCLGIDFVKNEARVAINGDISKVMKNPQTAWFLGNRFDSGIGNLDAEDYVLIFGRYYFDKNPFVGKIGGVRIWNRVLSEEELFEQSSCSSHQLPKTEVTDWKLTGTLVRNTHIHISEILCTRSVGLKVSRGSHK